MQGKVKWFKSDKGYGFIAGEDGNDYFVHYSKIDMEGYKTLEEGSTVEFTSKETDKGLVALDVVNI